MSDLSTLEGRRERVAVFGGVYSNHLALEAVLADARGQGADTVLCLGDVGGFGPHPDRAADCLRQSDAVVLQGNYDDSVGHGLEDCQCGYTDPRDNHFARLSYAYTLVPGCARCRDTCACSSERCACSGPTARRAGSTNSCGSR